MHAFDLAPALVRSRLQRDGRNRRPKMVRPAPMSERWEALGLSCRTNQPPRRPLDFPEEFLPRNLTGILAWWRADLGISLGTGVSAWADQSGNGDANRNATQGTAANQPTYIASDANFGNRASVSFDAAPKNLATGVWTVNLGAPYTMFLVARVVTANHNARVVASNGASAIDAYFGNIATQLYTDGPLGSYTQEALAIGAAPASRIVLASTAGPTSEMYSNSAVANQAFGGFTNANTSTAVTIGNYIVPGPYWGWDIAELGFVNRLLTAAEIVRLNAYFRSRYGPGFGA